MHISESSRKVLRLLRGGREAGYDEIVGELGLSQRQCRRVLTALVRAGAIHRKKVGRQAVFMLAPGQETLEAEIVPLTEDDVFALLAAAHAGRRHFSGTPLADDLASAVAKLEQGYRDRIVAFEPEIFDSKLQFGVPAQSDIDAAVFRAVRQALTDGRALRIAYHTLAGKRSYNRVIDPYILVSRNGSWLLVAYCRHSERILNFSLAGMERAEVEESLVRRKAGFDPDTYFRDSFGVFGGDVYLVRLQVSAEKVNAFRRKRYHPTQQVEEVLEDGGAIVSYEVSGLPEVAAFVRSWGACVQVLDPPELRQMVTETMPAAQ
jgi:predicted DNA-binding transcriptional regulator YafY